MQHLRWALVAAVLFALPASASAAGGGRPIVTPSSSHDLSQKLKRFTELPAPINPLYGTGSDPCVMIDDTTLVAITYGEEVTCTAELGTIVSTGHMHFCSTLEPEPWYADNLKDGRACALAASPETGSWVSVDGGPSVDLFRPQFTNYSPPTKVRLPVDNVFGLPPQTGTVYGYGWHANIRNLGLGRHTYLTTVEFEGELLAFPHVIHIVPRGSLAD